MNYLSTRGSSKLSSSFDALMKGLSDDGGLYIPEKLEKISFIKDEIENFQYTDYAKKIISNIFDDIDKKDLFEQIDLAYESFEKDILPIKDLDDIFYMELFHGQTFAFKDFALSLLPRLISLALKNKNIDKDILILTATSGDTGSAALYGFKNVDRTKIIVFYPNKGISEIQKRQMTSVDGNNTYAVGIEGNFDDAQSNLKLIFNDKEFKEYLDEKGYILSSANSINIARLVPQIVYYFYTYNTLLKEEKIKEKDKVSVCVPTGNFGNILAAFLARKMGLKINNLICASNKNNVLTDFINTGVYNIKRDFYITNSPSMDILVSSNLERFLYYQLGEDPEIVKKLMEDLKEKGEYRVDKDKLKSIYAYSFDDEDTLKEIKRVYDKYNYLIDTHTAVASLAANEYLKDHDEKVMLASTASAFKFAHSTNQALGIDYNDQLDAIDCLEKATNILADKRFKEILNKKEKQNYSVDKSEIKKIIKEIIN
ncbi:threonine synthase [Peptoniphilus obesi]|uniref:threonine synthase n=1 Tax=Peptoniphilus obesi TaxID=1472765 RepID=UPI0004B16037|nr:threonine synthase [Peptoniphilus obesi]